MKNAFLKIERSGDIITCATRMLQFSSEMQQTFHIYYPRPQEQLLLKELSLKVNCLKELKRAKLLILHNKMGSLDFQDLYSCTETPLVPARNPKSPGFINNRSTICLPYLSYCHAIGTGSASSPCLL
jgi:hypothetical protein